jgi:hypothetical protein
VNSGFVWKKSFYENISQWRNALPVLDALQKAGIKITLIKGAALSIPLYGDWGSRPMSDIDILISKSSVKMASQIFIIRKVHGYSVAKSYALYIRDLGHYPTELPRNLT